MDDIEKLKQNIQESGEYVGSVSTRKNISDFYRNHWLPISLEFQKKFGNEAFQIIEENASKMYELAKSPRPPKTKFLENIKAIDSILEKYELNSIREQGSSVEHSAKEQIKLTLNDMGFESVCSFIKKAESEYSTGNDKECCIQTRLAIEEFFRLQREKYSMKPVLRGTLGNHIDFFQNNLSLISKAERNLIQDGYYAFVSEKGNHATTDKPSSDDSKLALKLLYVLIEYCLDKFKSTNPNIKP